MHRSGCGARRGTARSQRRSGPNRGSSRTSWHGCHRPRTRRRRSGLGHGTRPSRRSMRSAISTPRSDPARCAIIRGVVHEHEARGLLEDYIGYASRILKQGGRPEWLERGIAAASIDDQRRDYRDWLMALGDLYLSARAARLDPTPVLKRMAERSNPERHAASPTPTREALAKFEDSAYFMTSILPQLR